MVGSFENVGMRLTLGIPVVPVPGPAFPGVVLAAAMELDVARGDA